MRNLSCKYCDCECHTERYISNRSDARGKGEGFDHKGKGKRNDCSICRAWISGKGVFSAVLSNTDQPSEGKKEAKTSSNGTKSLSAQPALCCLPCTLQFTSWSRTLESPQTPFPLCQRYLQPQTHLPRQFGHLLSLSSPTLMPPMVTVLILDALLLDM